MSEANKSRRAFDQTFKHNAVRMVIDEGMSQEEVALKLDVSRVNIGKWVTAYKRLAQDAFPGKGVRPAAEAELIRLRRELKEAQDERDILKKALAIFSRPKHDGSPL